MPAAAESPGSCLFSVRFRVLAATERQHCFRATHGKITWRCIAVYSITLSVSAVVSKDSRCSVPSPYCLIKFVPSCRGRGVSFERGKMTWLFARCVCLLCNIFLFLKSIGRGAGRGVRGGGKLKPEMRI